MEFQCRVIVQRRCTSCCSSVENIPLQAERYSARRQQLFAFPPESAFTFRPECCSESQRNRVRLQTGIAFTFDRIPQKASALASSGLAAGLSMGFSFIAEGLLVAHLADSPWRPLLSKAGYCVGFLIVILGCQQLFTENTLTVILPLLLHTNGKTLLRVLRLWSVVLSANLAGTFLFALCLARIVLFDARTQADFLAIGTSHFGAGFWTVAVRAIFAGWLIALMVWLLPGAESAKVSIIIIITYLIGLAGLNHIIAGSTTALFLVVMRSISFGTYFAQFFVPTLLGNIIGGVSLVAALGHAQVVGGKD
jgi:formate/nitrite transporter FocA (FNT family)